MRDSSPELAVTSRSKSLLIVRLGAMGDVIHTLPAAVMLREAFPCATLGWLIEERWAELLCTLRYPRAGRRSPERPLVDRVHTVNTAPWRRSLFSFNTWQQVAVALSDLRGIEYDAAIDFQGAIRSALLARWSGAPTIYGSAEPRENAASMFYTRKVETDGSHVVEQAMSLARAVTGRPSISPEISGKRADPGLGFPTDMNADKTIDRVTAGISKFAILNPGAGWGAKRWPAERYGAVAKELATDGITSLVNYGPGECDMAAAVESASDGAAQRVSCSIAELISLTRHARLFIGGDTGPMHLAAALRVPVVAIFGPTSPVRNGPFATRAIVLRSPSSITDHSRHREPEQGLLEITSSEVVAAARTLLGSASE